MKKVKNAEEIRVADKKLHLKAGHKNDMWFAVELPAAKETHASRTLIRKVFYNKANCNAYITTKNKELRHGTN